MWRGVTARKKTQQPIIVITDLLMEQPGGIVSLNPIDVKDTVVEDINAEDELPFDLFNDEGLTCHLLLLDDGLLLGGEARQVGLGWPWDLEWVVDAALCV